MERVLTQEERIRRAEEIYLRRRNARPQYNTKVREVKDRKKVPEEKNIRLFKRMALQIVICLLLYCIFYLIYDTNYAFSDTTISKTQEILNYDINIEEMYKYVNDKLMSFMNQSEEDDNEQVDNETEDIGDDVNEKMENIEDNTEEEIQDDEGNVEEDTIETSAEETDLKKIYSLILPVSRRIYIV